MVGLSVTFLSACRCPTQRAKAPVTRSINAKWCGLGNALCSIIKLSSFSIAQATLLIPTKPTVRPLPFSVWYARRKSASASLSLPLTPNAFKCWAMLMSTSSASAKNISCSSSSIASSVTSSIVESGSVILGNSSKPSMIG